MNKIFVISDTHGLNEDFFKVIETSEFDANNNSHTLVLNGDIIDQFLDIDLMDSLLIKIFSWIDTHDNIVFLSGNHERNFISKTKIHKERLLNLPVIFMTDNIFICHGWFNPMWKVSEHNNKVDYRLKTKQVPLVGYGDVINGSPAAIFTREKLKTDFFGYKSFEEYEIKLMQMYPNHIFIFGHFFNFMWNYEPTKGMHYFEYRDELDKFNNNKQSAIQDISSNYDYSKPFISKHQKIYGLDLYTKCYMIGLKHHINIFSFKSYGNNHIIYENDDRSLEEILKDG
ncbi:MAG: metallophosphoesterase [Mycoplasma sp.]